MNMTHLMTVIGTTIWTCTKLTIRLLEIALLLVAAFLRIIAGKH